MKQTGTNENSIPFFRQIRWRYALILAGIVALLIAALWLVNRYFLEGYYRRNKVSQVDEIRRSLDERLREGLTETSMQELLAACETAGVSLVVLQQDRYFNVIVLTNTDRDSTAFDRLRRFMSGASLPIEESYREGEGYRISRTRDPRTSAYQIECIGSVDTEQASERYYFELLTPLDSLAAMAGLSNRFLLILGLITLAVGTALTVLVSWQLTQPIRELTTLSKRMADLDFSARYTGGENDELGVLGSNMNEMAGRLERSVGELKQANEQLEKDILEKERINEKRKELLINISHELKTPIALIQGYSEGMRDGISEDPEAREEYCNIILDEAGKMNRLVRQLLNLNELESGQIEPDPSKFDLAEVLREESQLYMRSAAERQAAVLIQLPETLPVCTDLFLTEQILQNYMSNAVNHVSGGGSITVTAGAAGEKVWFAVENDGETIPEDQLEDIWEKFYKVDRARTRAYGGSGIGLSIVKASAERLGGICTVRNRPGGVVFTAEFPARLPKGSSGPG
ncbi:MAG: HAMP domain-containing histidine kinase [Lachnospiraceae bacterium]|nr:HAMP domain-containing histidine kinase [Lachnospiraceae bacterium]